MPENYIGFWRRYVALMVDLQVISILLFIVVVIFIVLVKLLFEISPELGSHFLRFLKKIFVYSMLTTIGPVPLYPFTIVFLYSFYFTILESSSMQATFGKRAIRAVVTDHDGDQITFIRANVRFFGKIISAILLMFGFIMTGFTMRKQALHDFLSGCLVVEEEYSDRDTNYVGFWRRFIAIQVDCNIIYVIPGFLGGIYVFILGWFLFHSVTTGVDSATIINIISSIMSTISNYSGAIKYWNLGIYICGYLIFIWLYFTIFEFSSIQATPGKLAIGAVVTNLEEGRISFAKSTVRFWIKLLTPIVILLIGYGINLIFPFYIYILQFLKTAILQFVFASIAGKIKVFLITILIFAIPFIGFIMAVFTRRKQAFHDIIAGSLVVNKRPSEDEGEVVFEQKAPESLAQEEQQEVKELSLEDKVMGMAKDYYNNNNCMDYYSKKLSSTKKRGGKWEIKGIDDFTYLVHLREGEELYTFEVDFNTGIVIDVWSAPYLREKYRNLVKENPENNEPNP